jgi:hypothetical protein
MVLSDSRGQLVAGLLDGCVQLGTAYWSASCDASRGGCQVHGHLGDEVDGADFSGDCVSAVIAGHPDHVVRFEEVHGGPLLLVLADAGCLMNQAEMGWSCRSPWWDTPG